MNAEFVLKQPIIAIALFVVLSISVFAGWEKAYGSGVGNSVEQTTDGGYIVVGYTPETDRDIYLIKTNAEGDSIWSRRFGGYDRDIGCSVAQTPDSGYIIAGYSRSFGAGDYDVWLLKTDAAGDTLWTRLYGGDGNDIGNCVVPTFDGGYAVIGWTPENEGDFYIIRTDSAGDTLWTKTYGGSNYDCGSSIVQTSDSGFIMVGETMDFGGADSAMLAIKTDAEGEVIWTKTYGGDRWDWGTSVAQTSDGGYIFSGFTYSFGIDPGLYLVKTDSAGDTVWTRKFSGSAPGMGESVTQTLDGGYVIVGSKRDSIMSDLDIYLVKTDSDGDTMWTRTLGGSEDDQGFSVRQTSEGGFVITGLSESLGGYASHVYLANTDSMGFIPPRDYHNIVTGWNLLSYPYNDTTATDELYPFAAPMIFGYSAEAGYYYLTEVFPGIGFWVLSREDTMLVWTPPGAASVSDTLLPGWNLIGTADHPVSVSAISTNPPSLLMLNPFGWNPSINAYECPDTLYPGCGYWVLSRDYGRITVGP